MVRWRSRKCGYERKAPSYKPGKTVYCPSCGASILTFRKQAKEHEAPNIAQHSLKGEHVTKGDMSRAGFTRRPRKG